MLHRALRPVIKAWTEAEIDTSEFGRLGTDLLGGSHHRSATASRPAPPLSREPQLAALAIVAMVERCNYYAMTGQVAGGTWTGLTDTLADITFASCSARPPA